MIKSRLSDKEKEPKEEEKEEEEEDEEDEEEEVWFIHLSSSKDLDGNNVFRIMIPLM